MPETVFGVSLFPARDVTRVRELAVAADDGGLDLVGVQDHPYAAPMLDAFALIGHLLDHTERIRLFPDVANLPLRPPSVLAKAAASLDVLSGGRVEMGLGAGGFWDAIVAMGGPRRSPSEAVRSVEEALADKAVSLIVVGTPNETHYELAKRALLAGKHVVIDKPFAATS